MGAFSQRGQPRERYVEINSPTPTLIDLPDIRASCSLPLVSRFFFPFPSFFSRTFFHAFSLSPTLCVRRCVRDAADKRCASPSDDISNLSIFDGD